MENELEWRPDPALPGRERAWRNGQWLKKVRDESGEYSEPFLGDHVRWQYGVVNIGMYNTMTRLNEVLAVVGAAGWELITIYDKASNWMTDKEKGFMLMKRPVPAGVRLDDDEWCITLSQR